MSLIPHLFNWWENLEDHHRLLDGLGLHLEQQPSQPKSTTSIYLDAIPRRYSASNLRTLLQLLQQHENNNSVVPPTVKKDDFQVVLDVQQFEPHEIEVKVVDNYIVITAKHEDKQDEHGWVSRQFVRRCLLPENSNIEQLTSRLSSDGLLTIVAPKKRPLKEESIQRTIKIKCTGKPFQNKSQGKSKKSEEDKEDKTAKK